MWVLAVLAFGVFWLYRFNSALKATPEEARKFSPKRWTKEQLKEAYDHVKQHPVDFLKHVPPAQQRRYIIVGGSGLVGGDIVLQLLERGQSPSSIRIADFAPVSRDDMLPKTSACDFVKTDITSIPSVEAAFSKPWPSSVSHLPLTVFHTAALIRPQERNPLLYQRVSRVNRDGAIIVLNTAKKHGCDIFIATSSGSVSITPPQFFPFWPWQSSPKGYFQICDERDFDLPIRPHEKFFANYARSKAEAERAICAANSPGFRTGCLRPGNAIYGQKTDPLVGNILREGSYVAYVPQVVQSYVYSRNVSLAHLQFEAALLPSSSPTLPACAGRPFVITDSGPPITFRDMALACETLSEAPFLYSQTQPIVIHIIAHIMESWSLLLARFPFLTSWFGWKETNSPINMLQPAVLNVGIHSVVDDSQARKKVEEGGIGYTPVATTLEGFCTQIGEFNEDVKRGRIPGVGLRGEVKGKDKVVRAAEEAKGLGA
ncbi:dehydrogenase-like protein [Apiosordaria backusii]|uniref:Dehydrogenase-like protein n=1 Tax=Apiosordaria backusii TaxID=314023 RepID=A0AA40B7L5_9PEZI|nr:dehydrogenase-like protein [Apiosordaria backusii]